MSDDARDPGPGERSKIRTESRTFSIATLGADNPLPMVGAPLENPYTITGAIPQEIIDGSMYGNPANLYPYRLQDDYDRHLSTRDLQVVVLENERMRAAFLPELGGRLWELYDKVAGKQLLYSPPTIQFANLALRNAWFAGGIEWNIGTRGHSPGTCSPMHAATLKAPDGQKVLRLWEFDRLRAVVYQIDAWLPPDSAVLLVAVRIRNPNTTEVPMYWWTNAAVPEHEGSRVVAPSSSAFATDYGGGISRVTPTDDSGTDSTWPTRSPRARDFFFDLAQSRRPWIVNTDQDGDGLAMLSTPRLRGRKLFVWGNGPGGDRWQDWLSPQSGRYAEIQAGLAQTQFQHLAMPAGAEWRWLEAYGNARLDADVAHGVEWSAAVAHGEARVEALLAADALDSALAAAASWADEPPHRVLAQGSGWGALESRYRRRTGEPWIAETGTPFGIDSITADQQPWLSLLEGEGFAGAKTFVNGPAWEDLLGAQPQSSQSLVHRAVMAHARGATDAAAALYLRVLEQASGPPEGTSPLHDGLNERALAHRGLAVIALADGDAAAAVGHYRQACALDDDSALLVEAAGACLAADAADTALDLLRPARTGQSRGGRIRLLHATALAATGETAQAAALLREGIEVADLREGEGSLAALWRQVCPGQDVPPAYEFAMG